MPKRQVFIAATRKPRRGGLSHQSSELRRALLRLSRHERAADLSRRALRALAGFARALKVKYEDIEVGIDFDPEPGLADNGDLDLDLQALLEAAGQAAKQAETALAIFVTS